MGQQASCILCDKSWSSNAEHLEVEKDMPSNVVASVQVTVEVPDHIPSDKALWGPMDGAKDIVLRAQEAGFCLLSRSRADASEFIKSDPQAYDPATIVGAKKAPPYPGLQDDLIFAQMDHGEGSANDWLLGPLSRLIQPDEEEFILEGPEAAVGLLEEGVSEQHARNSVNALRLFRGALTLRTSSFSVASVAPQFEHEAFAPLLAIYVEANEFSRCIGTQHSLDGAVLICLEAIMRHLCGAVQEALQTYQLALQMVVEANGKDTVEWVTIMCCIGDAFRELGDCDKAMEAYMKAYKLYESDGLLSSTVEGIILLMSIGASKYLQEQHAESIQFSEKAAIALEASGNADSNVRAVVLHNLGLALLRQERLVESLDHLWTAHAIRERLDSLETPEGRHLSISLEKTKQRFRTGPETESAGGIFGKNQSGMPGTARSSTSSLPSTSPTSWGNLSPSKGRTSPSKRRAAAAAAAAEQFRGPGSRPESMPGLRERA